MTNNPAQELQRIARDILNKAPQAGLIGGEWQRIRDTVDFCTIIVHMASSRPYTDDELKQFIAQLEVHHQFILNTIHKKRRPHPERSNRRFM